MAAGWNLALEEPHMATLILTAVGTAVGGPIGGAIGAVIGQRADNAIFAPRARHGPRLGELAVQTSSYGTAIPKIFGTMRVAGTVIWATDLREEKATGGGGKGRPKTISYSYSASFAVALSGRPIGAVRRIWADGKLLRGVAGDFKSRTKYRLYTGGEDQPVDPMIATAEGIGRTPAFRGMAYAMFEDFQLGDYGNRIPSLTFEVVADPIPVPIGAIAEQLSRGAVADGETVALAGYAASGDSVRGAIEALADVIPLSLVEEAGQLIITAAAGAPVLVSEAGARSAEGGGRTQIARRAAGSVADQVSIVYHDPARDYQTGLQRAARNGPGLRSDRRTLPAVLEAEDAKAIAEYRLASLSAARATATLHLPLRRSGVRPGARVRIEGHAGRWRVEHWTLGGAGLVTLELVQVAGVLRAVEADSGRPIGHPDLACGPTTLHLFDLPLSEGESSRLRLFAVAAGEGAGWRRAELMTSYDGSASWTDAGATVGVATIGQARTALAPAGSALLDERNSVDVELLNDTMWLEGRTNSALVGGANLAVLGDELIQFGQAEALGERRFRLSRLLRGRRGTEWAAEAHSIGEAFALIEPEAISVIQPPMAMLGGETQLLAIGLGDEDGVVATRLVSGEANRPPPPVHLTAQRQANGDIAIAWVRRSRNGWTWLGGSDTPLGEETETYRVGVAGAGFARAVTVNQPTYIYSAADQAADGLVGPLAIEICQLGTVTASRPAYLTFG
jgi:hypothetical protein